jgi:hypothetical protein
MTAQEQRAQVGAARRAQWMMPAASRANCWQMASIGNTVR